MPSFSSTEWQRYKKRRATEEQKPVTNPRNDWQWYVEGNSGHDGVHTFEDQLVWYTQPLNPHAGEAASVQSFEDFLENGPGYLKPPNDQILDELYDAVKALVQML